MTKYVVVNKEVLQKLLKCATKDEEECYRFLADLYDMSKDLLFGHEASLRNAQNTDFCITTLVKNLFMFTMFCRENWELINEMMSCVEYKSMTEAERNAYKGKFPDNLL